MRWLLVGEWRWVRFVLGLGTARSVSGFRCGERAVEVGGATGWERPETRRTTLSEM